MTRYDSQGVPVLSFHNPAGAILYPTGLYTYAMGNTRGRDMTELLGTSKEQHLDLLFLACGDVRNVLCTVSELSLRKPRERPKSLKFHLNDYDPSVVARNAVLLEVAGAINPNISADIDFLWNIWYNLALSEAHFDRLRNILSELLEKNFDSDESFLKFPNSAVLRECHAIWKDWIDLDLEVTSVQKERSRLIEERDFKIDTQCLLVLTQMMMAVNEKTDFILLSTPENPFYEEIKHWYIEGSTSDQSDKTNPTLVRPFVHKWKQHYNSCAFESYLPIERQDLTRCKTLTAACKENLTSMVKSFQQQKRNHPTTLEVTLWTGDALGLCTSGFPPELLFDVIDTSNVSDHIGLLNVLICCTPRLKVPNRSLLYTSSMLWSGGCANIEEFYNKCVGVPVQLLPTVLGVKLAVDLDLGSNKLPDKIISTEEILCWVKAEPKRTLLTIDQAGDVVQALLRLAERCFNLLNEQSSQVFGVTLSSPLTFLRIIHQIQPLFKGGATQIFDLLENELPVDFNKKFGLSWNLLKSSIGSRQEPIVEIKASIDISVASWFKGTPIPMICIVEESLFKQAQLQWLFGLPESVESTTFSAIYNSLRYDDDARIVTFHLRERDWNKLKSNSWMWISCSDMNPVINREPVHLGDETVESVVRIDPVQKFGLSSVQTFIVTDESNTNSQVLKALKVEENTLSYFAELEIVDSVNCNAKAMKITFQPVNCPTEVHIGFEGAKGDTFIMYFSCAVDEKTSKFQISRTRGKVFSRIPKREDGTTGELVVQNPAPVPFHALTLWDAKLHDIRVWKQMFRTKLDRDLKEQNKFGSPFFNLRDSIAIIFEKHVEEPTVPMVHCVDELGIIEEPYQTSDDIARKKGFVVKVQEMYKWKYLPVAKVLFCDFQQFTDMLRNDCSGKSLIATYFFVTWCGNLVNRIVADQKEKSLFLKMLKTNAARVPQDTGSDVWKNSYITLLFPRERTLDSSDPAAMASKMRSFPFNPFLHPETSQTKEDFSPDSFSKFDTGMDYASVFDPPQWAPPLREPACAFCRSKNGDLKRCSSCKRVFYCSKKCQKHHWKEHKPDCKSIS